MFELEVVDTMDVAMGCGCSAVARCAKMFGVVGCTLRLCSSNGNGIALGASLTGIGNEIARAGKRTGEIELSTIGFTRNVARGIADRSCASVDPDFVARFPKEFSFATDGMFHCGARWRYVTTLKGG